MRNEVVVSKIAGYTDKILKYCSGVSYDQFVGDSMLVEACVFNLSQMGELANKVDPDYAASHREIPWHHLYGLRNRIVHDYDGVNLALIWQIVSEDLPDLKRTLAKICK